MDRQDRMTLEQLGLSYRESSVYIALLELGQSTISSIARKTGFHRPTIYKVLPSLIQKGLVTLSPARKGTKYVAEPPEMLEKMLDNLHFQINELIPQLKSTYASSEKKPIVRFLEGKEQIRTIFADLLNTLGRGGIFYRYSSAVDPFRGKTYLPKNYEELRDKKQLERFVITSERRSLHSKPSLTREVRVVPREFDLFEHNITQLMYGDKVAMIDYNSDTALVIENPVIAEFHSKLFRLLFSKLESHKRND